MVPSVPPLILVGLVFLWTLRAEESTVCVWGGRCILPCTFPFGKDTLIHWFQKPKKHIHSYYDNRDHLEQQIPSFQERTSLFHDEIPRGNASLLLLGVKVEDQGAYMCYTSTVSDSSEKDVELKVEALVREVDIVQINDRITCSSERIYPKPTLSWSTNPQEPHKPEVQVMEDQLYKISSTIAVNSSTNVNYSCTVSAGSSKRKTTLFPSRHISTSNDEATISCSRLNTRVTQLTWRFNHKEIIVTRTGTSGGYTPSDSWRKHVKNVNQSGDLQLQHLSSSQEGTFTCELSSGEETFVTVTKLTLSETPPDKAAPGGVAVGVVVVVVVVVVVLVVAAIYIFKYRKTKEGSAQHPPETQALRGRNRGSGPDEEEGERSGATALNDGGDRATPPLEPPGQTDTHQETTEK